MLLPINIVHQCVSFWVLLPTDPSKNSITFFYFQDPCIFRSQGQSNLTPVHHCIEFRFSHAQRCQSLKCGSRFHCLVPNLRHQSRRVFLETGVPSEIAVHEDCDFVNVFLSSESYCRFVFPEKIPCCIHQRNTTKLSCFAHPLGQICCCFRQVLSVLGKVIKSRASRSVSCCISSLQNWTHSSV